MSKTTVFLVGIFAFAVSVHAALDLPEGSDVLNQVRARYDAAPSAQMSDIEKDLAFKGRCVSVHTKALEAQALVMIGTGDPVIGTQRYFARYQFYENMATETYLEDLRRKALTANSAYRPAYFAPSENALVGWKVHDGWMSLRKEASTGYFFAKITCGKNGGCGNKLPKAPVGATTNYCYFYETIGGGANPLPPPGN